MELPVEYQDWAREAPPARQGTTHGRMLRPPGGVLSGRRAKQGSIDEPECSVRPSREAYSRVPLGPTEYPWAPPASVCADRSHGSRLAPRGFAVRRDEHDVVESGDSGR